MSELVPVNLPVSILPVTLATAANTADAVDVVSVTVPANTWDDGEEVVLQHFANYAGSASCVPSIYAAGESFDPTDGGFSQAWGGLITTRFRRVGNKIHASDANGAVAVANSAPVVNGGNGYSTQSSSGTAFPANGTEYATGTVDFATDTILKISVQMNAADPANSYTPSSASAYKFNTSLK